MFDGVIRSHEARELGFSQDHSNCWTVFSASSYCNSNNYGAVFEYTVNDMKPRPYSYITADPNESNNSKGNKQIIQKNHALIKQFKLLIHSNQAKLMAQFKMFDLNRNGSIKTNVWAEILAKNFNNEISTKQLIYIKDLLCECENMLDLVNYRTLFPNPDKSQKKQIDQNYMNVVKNLFEILDKNHDKKICSSELKDALEIVNKKIGSKYSINEESINLIKNLDINGDNEIDFAEFKQAFFGSHIEENQDESVDSDASEEESVQIVRV